jgi:hypothetical protein
MRTVINVLDRKYVNENKIDKDCLSARHCKFLSLCYRCEVSTLQMQAKYFSETRVMTRQNMYSDKSKYKKKMILDVQNKT